MPSPCLSGGGLKRETIGYLLPSFQALRTQFADFHSQNFRDNAEWMLNPAVFQRLTKVYFVPEVDLFASRLSCQIHPFASWKLEPGAWAIDSFSISWTALQFYAFPPFSILGRVLAKVQHVGATGMLVTPLWSTQPWFPQLLEMVIEHPCMLTPGNHLLQLQGKLDVLHSLHSKLSLLVTIISGQHSKVQAYRQQLHPSFVMPEEKGQRNSMIAHCDDGESFVVHRKSIPLLLM